MKQIDRQPLGRQLHGSGNFPLAQSIERGLLFIDPQNQSLAFSFAIPVNIDDTFGGVKDFADSLRQPDPLVITGTIDLCDQSLQHRWPGWHLGDRNGGAIFFGNLADGRAHPHRNIVALQIPFRFGQQVHLNICHFRSLPHEIVSDQTVKIVR